MKYLYIAFVSVVTLAALAWVIHLGIQQKPVAKIKLSEFSSVKEVGDSVLMRLRQEIKDHRIVFLGVDPEEPEHLEIWRLFLQSAKEPGWKFDRILVEEGLAHGEWNLGEVKIDLKKEEESLKAKWSMSGEQPERIAIVVPHVYSTQLLKGNPVQRLKSGEADSRFLSLTIVPLAESPHAPEVLRLPCTPEGADYTGKSPLGCAIRNKAMFWSKPFKKGVRLGVMEQFGLHDYLLFYRSNVQTSTP